MMTTVADFGEPFATASSWNALDLQQLNMVSLLDATLVVEPEFAYGLGQEPHWFSDMPLRVLPCWPLWFS